jgi:hypothetical protein
VIFYAYLTGIIFIVGSLFYFGYNIIGVLLVLLFYIVAFKAKPKNLTYLGTYSSSNTNKVTDNVNCSTQKLNICPRCGALLKERTAPFKSSWECSNYPKCEYIKSRMIHI